MYNLTAVKKYILAKQGNVWREALLNKPKLKKNLHTVKNNFYTEKYVKKHICKRERSLFAQLPVGILPIEIEIILYAAERFNLYTSSI